MAVVVPVRLTLCRIDEAPSSDNDWTGSRRLREASPAKQKPTLKCSTGAAVNPRLNRPDFSRD